MDKKDKILLEAYLKSSLEDIELSAGRIILDSGSEAIKAGANEEEEAKKAARNFFVKKFAEVRNLICEKYQERVSKFDDSTDKGVELAGYIAAILESNNISVGPLNYIFISVWLVKFGIDKLCQEKPENQ